MATVVSALFRDRLGIEHAVASILQLGFQHKDISVLMSDETLGREFGFVKHTKTAQGAAAGAATGGTLGAIIAGLAAIASIAIPGIGLLATGPVVAALAGAGAGGAAGTLVGGLIGAGIPEHEAKVLGPGVEKGNVLLGVHVEDRNYVERVKQALREAGGQGATTTKVANTPPQSVHR